MIFKRLLLAIHAAYFHFGGEILGAFETLVLDMAHAAVHDNRRQLSHAIALHQERTIDHGTVAPDLDIAQIQLHIDNHIVAHAGSLSLDDPQRILSLRHSSRGKRCHI